MQKQKDHQHHIPVLLEEVIQLLQPERGETYLDLTAGAGGHAGAIMERTLQYDGSVLIDRDATAIQLLRDKFAKTSIKLINDDFYNGALSLLKSNIKFDLILADLGMSSMHLDNIERGFSIQSDGPLDMRMDQSQKLTAYDVVNGYDLKRLRGIIGVFGQEKHANKIAQRICENRPIKTTQELKKIVEKAYKGRWSKVHPATKTFQAIRIEVNEEIKLLESALKVWVNLLKPGGRLAVVSFHSLEDSVVKKYFKSLQGGFYDQDFTLINKKPICPSQTKVDINPRSRSAKLRAVVKNKNKEGAF